MSRDVEKRGILDRLIEFDSIGEQAFLKKYARGQGSRTTWLKYAGREYPIKAVFASAHNPPIAPTQFTTHDAKRYLKRWKEFSFVERGGLSTFHLNVGAVNSPAPDPSRQAAISSGSALDDVDQDHIGNADPEYKRRMAGSYLRDDKVRQHVLDRAQGICEFCGSPGFRRADGRPYLETHHVISLSEKGPDKPHNVIALCANDHRRAHFGEDWAELQKTFLIKLEQYR